VSIGDGVTSIGDYAFDHCVNLTLITIPESVEIIGERVFYHCENLTLITISKSVESIGEGAFSYCLSLAAIQIEDGNAYFLSEEGVLFDKDKTTLICCPGGKTGRYTVPDGITSIEYIAFSDCSSLTSIIIPGSVTKIEYAAFSGCTALRDVAVFWNIPSEVSIDAGIFYGVDTRNIRLHVPLGTEAAYRAADVWKDFDINEVQQKPLLENLTVGAGNLFIEFNPFVFHYTIAVPEGIENITLQATPVEGATVSGDGQQALNIGENTVEITVTSQGDESVYTVAITRLSVDYDLQALSSAEAETGLTTVTFSGLEPYPLIDVIQLKYRLAIGEFSGSLPLHFDAGHSKTFDTSVEVKANSIYEFTLYMGLEYYDNSKSLSATIHYNGLGQPSYVTVNYVRHENTVTASSGSDELSAYSFDMPGDNIKTVAISDLTFIGNIIPTAIAEPGVQPAIAVYPNPATGYITISGLQPGETLRFFDLYGRLLLTQTAKSESETIPAGHWPEGVYLLRVNNQSIKFIKN
jgi:hypothetical protein